MIVTVFNFLAAAIGLFGFVYSILRGPELIVACALSVLATTVAMLAQVQHDRSAGFRSALIPTIQRELQSIGPDSRQWLMSISTRPEMRSVLLDLLEDVLHVQVEPKERYWTYVVIGDIGGRKARKILTKGLEDSNDYARSGAEAALMQLSKSPPR